MAIEHISLHPNFIDTIAELQFAQWGKLTGYPTLEEYAAFLDRCTRSPHIPHLLVAHTGSTFLGSVNLIGCDMDIRPELTPWLAHLFVIRERRRNGIGTALARAAVEEARTQGFERLYLYTSGALPRFYGRVGFVERERVDYLGKERTVMQYSLRKARPHGLDSPAACRPMAHNRTVSELVRGRVKPKRIGR